MATDLTRNILRQAQERNIPMTEEQAAIMRKRLARKINRAVQSATEEVIVAAVEDFEIDEFDKELKLEFSGSALKD